MDILSKIKPNIDFIYEPENNNILSFLDIFLQINNNKQKFEVHYRSTN